jgi:type IV pilus assembly protein PilA
VRSYMERRMERIRERGEDGFTLIELLVVLLIIGILLGIAIPTFLSVTKGAGNTTAESNLQTALTAVDAYYTQNGASYQGIPGTGTNTLAAQDTSLTFETGSATTSASNISYFLEGGDNQNIVLTDFSTSGNRCYVIADIKDTTVPGTPGGTPTAANVNYGWFTPGTGTGTCEASNAYGQVTTWQTGSFPS